MYPEKRTVIVNTKQDQAFRGVLWRRRAGLLILRDAQMLQPGGAVVPMDGEVAVPAALVDFIQVLREAR